jgi:hypothetical protein
MKDTTMMSLFDYLGKPAGDVARAATGHTPKVNFGTRYVETRTYKGDVMLYPKWFLDEYFSGGTGGRTNNKQMLFG